MDAFTAVGLASWIGVSASVLQRIFSSRFALLQRSYGYFVALLISTLSPSTATQYERIENLILGGEDENALAFRQAVTDECNMTAVAVS